MEDKKKIYPIEETYFILKKYLNDKLKESPFPSINEKTNFYTIGENIDQKFQENSPKKSLVSSIDDLHNQLSTIIYLSDLSYFYIQNSGVGYYKILGSPTISTNRLINIKKLLNEKIQLFKINLKNLLEANDEDSSLKQLAICYINYLENLIHSNVSSLAQFAASFIGEIDFEHLKSLAKEDLAAVNNLLKEEEYFDALEEVAFPSKKEEGENDDEFFDAEDKKESFIRRIIDCLRKLMQIIRYKCSGVEDKFFDAKEEMLPNSAINKEENEEDKFYDAIESLDPVIKEENKSTPCAAPLLNRLTHNSYNIYCAFYKKAGDVAKITSDVVQPLLSRIQLF